MSAKLYLVLVAVLVAGAGCGNASSTAGSSAPTTAAAGTASNTPTASPSPAFEPLPNGYDPKRDAQADITAALAASEADKHPVLLDFGADWCPDCVVLGQTFRSDTVRPIVGGFHVVSIDVGKFDRHLALASKYHLNLRTSGIPGLVVLSGTGTVKTTTNDGSFSNARTMTAEQVAAFLKRWK